MVALDELTLKRVTGQFDISTIRKADLRSLSLDDISVLKGCTSLASINLAENSLSSLDALQPLIKLESLDASHNSISSLSALSQLASLKMLNLSHNRITKLSELEHLAKIPYIKSLSLAGNPVCATPGFRDLVIRMLPQVRVLDGHRCDLPETAADENELDRMNAVEMPPSKPWFEGIEMTVDMPAGTRMANASKSLQDALKECAKLSRMADTLLEETAKS